MQGCPACRRLWPDDLEVCPRCLAELVDDLDATLTCAQCGHVCPSRMQTCPSCFALLRAEDVDAGDFLVRSLARTGAVHPPPGRRPFADGLDCTMARQSPRGRLGFVGPEGYLEATVTGPGTATVPPLTCWAAGELLFRVLAYGAADEAVVVHDAEGAALATFLRGGTLLAPAVDVRDETSAPVARLVVGERGWEHRLVETGGTELAVLERTELELDGWVDDEWALRLTVGAAERLPLRPLALVALVVAAKVLLGRADPRPSGTGLAVGLLGMAEAAEADPW